MNAEISPTDPARALMATNQSLSLIYGGYTSAGPKTRNEDAFAALLPSGPLREQKGAVAVMADGVSCAENAQLASQTTVTTFIQDYLSTPETWDVRTSAARVLGALNSWLHAQAHASTAKQDSFVTTFSGLVLKSTTAHLIHCGDSRIWRLRGGQLTQLSTDHCLRRQDGSTMLTRALGLDYDLKIDYQQRSLRLGDTLILTTDGVHEALKPQQFRELLTPLATGEIGFIGEGRHAALERLARHIVDSALAEGSRDNASCLLLRVQRLPVGDLNETHRRLTERVIPPVLQVGQKIDDYTVLRVLHSGPRSHLYLVSHPRFRQKFVLKVPSLNFAEDPQYLEAFAREQWVGRRMDHPNLMKIHEPQAGTRFLYHCCEYIEGQTLRQWLRDHPAPSLDVVRDFAKQLCTALRAMQRLGMLHRDLKPDNVMLTPAGVLKLLDFGTVHVRGLDDVHNRVPEEVPVGTADYLAPEYLMGERGEYRSDIFSLGVLVYELLTGEKPYKSLPPDVGRIRSYSRWQYRFARSFRPDLPLWVDLCLRKACAPRPSERYESLSEFMRDLEVPNQSLVAAHVSRPLLERNPLLFWQCLSAVLFVLLLVALYF
jgi:Serine/threonine protein kinase